jgi:hypothetical protein
LSSVIDEPSSVTDLTMPVGDPLSLTHTSPTPVSFFQCAELKVAAGTIMVSVPKGCYFSISSFTLLSLPVKLNGTSIACCPGC